MRGTRAARLVTLSRFSRDTTPLPYRTPYRTRHVAVAEDVLWEKLPLQEAPFHGVGAKPIEFPEIESTDELETARKQAARCFRGDAETGSADYAVPHREDIFSMVHTNPADRKKLSAMLARRVQHRENPFPGGRPASLDDMVFLLANLSRLVIDPYREACQISVKLAAKLSLAQPFLVTGFDDAPAEARAAVGQGVVTKLHNLERKICARLAWPHRRRPVSRLLAYAPQHKIAASDVG